LTQGAPDIPSSVYAGGVDFCQDDTALEAQITSIFANSPTPQNSQDLVAKVRNIPKAAVCSMGASRANRVAMFGNIMECEIWSRLDYFFAVFADSETANFGTVINNCIDHGSDVGHSNHSRGDGERAFDDCYNGKIHEFFNRIDQQYLPGVFRTDSDAKPLPKAPGLPGQENGAAGIFLLGALANTSERKKRVRRFLRKALLFFGINSAVLCFATYYSLGGCCGGDDHKTPIAICIDPHTYNQGDTPPANTSVCCKDAPDQSSFKENISGDPELCKTCGAT
jgi:hypothetical protein